MARVVWTADRGAWRPTEDDLDGGTLFVLSALGSYRHVTIVVDAGRVFEVNGGLADLWPQLGWPTDIATWVAEPRDIDDAQADALWSMLRMVRPSDATPPGLVEDDTIAKLRAAVWADPGSDAVRTVYADALLDRGDPRGELIALQLGRARTGGAATERERDLVARYGAACAMPLAPYLETGFTLERGFLRECVVNYRVELPKELCAHPSWSTVDSIGTGNRDLLCGPTMRARQVALYELELAKLAAHPTPLSFEVLCHHPLHPRRGRRVNGGIWPMHVDTPGPDGHVEAENWRGGIQPGALANVRVLAIRAASAGELRNVLECDFATQLRQLDALISHDDADFHDWREAVAAARVPLLTFRFWCVLPDHDFTTEPYAIGFQREPHGLTAIVELEDPVDAKAAGWLLRTLRLLARPLTGVVELRDRGDPPDVGFRRELAQIFAEVVVPTAPTSSLAPDLERSG